MGTLFFLLLTGHLVGDWIVQTDWQAANKTTSWKANQQHVATYHLVLLLAIIWLIRDWKLIPALALSWILHSLIDRRWPVKRLLQITRSPAFAETTLGILTTDQTLHIITLTFMAVWLAK